MNPLFSHKGERECAELVRSSVKTVLFVPAGVVLFCALLLGLLATLAGLPPAEMVFSFTAEAMDAWISTTGYCLLIPYILAAVLFPAIGTPDRRETFFTLWYDQTSPFSISASVSTLVASLSAYFDLATEKLCFVAGESPKLE